MLITYYSKKQQPPFLGKPQGRTESIQEHRIRGKKNIIHIGPRSYGWGGGGGGGGGGANYIQSRLCTHSNPTAYYNPFQLTWNTAGKRRNSKSCYRLITLIVYNRAAYPNICYSEASVWSLLLSFFIYSNVPSEQKRVVLNWHLVKCHQITNGTTNLTSHRIFSQIASTVHCMPFAISNTIASKPPV